MKNKQGFTLAEVLITLGIIGVVAALTAPALVKNTANAQIGPTLAKVKSTVEVANEQLLYDQGINDLSKLPALDGYTQDSAELYPEYLTKYISGSANLGSVGEDDYKYTDYSGTSSLNLAITSTCEFKFSDSISIFMQRNIMGESSGVNNIDPMKYTAKGSFKGSYYTMIVDINGPKTEPNSIGKDLFYLIVDKGGKVVAAGSQTFDWIRGNTGVFYYDGMGLFVCNEENTSLGWGCAGSIFDNNLKVIYQ